MTQSRTPDLPYFCLPFVVCVVFRRRLIFFLLLSYAAFLVESWLSYDVANRPWVGIVNAVWSRRLSLFSISMYNAQRRKDVATGIHFVCYCCYCCCCCWRLLLLWLLLTSCSLLGRREKLSTSRWRRNKRRKQKKKTSLVAWHCCAWCLRSTRFFCLGRRDNILSWPIADVAPVAKPRYISHLQYQDSLIFFLFGMIFVCLLWPTFRPTNVALIVLVVDLGCCCCCCCYCANIDDESDGFPPFILLFFSSFRMLLMLGLHSLRLGTTLKTMDPRLPMVSIQSLFSDCLDQFSSSLSLSFSLSYSSVSHLTSVLLQSQEPASIVPWPSLEWLDSFDSV